MLWAKLDMRILQRLALKIIEDSTSKGRPKLIAAGDTAMVSNAVESTPLTGYASDDPR